MIKERKYEKTLITPVNNGFIVYVGVEETSQNTKCKTIHVYENAGSLGAFIRKYYKPAFFYGSTPETVKIPSDASTGPVKLPSDASREDNPDMARTKYPQFAENTDGRNT